MQDGVVWWLLPVSETREVAVCQASLRKAPTGIRGFDEITRGGLPRGRVSLLAGSAGSGKTVVAMNFLVNGAEMYGEPGLFVSFEESAQDLERNFSSQGFDLRSLEQQGTLAFDHIRIERSEMEETGEYDLEGLFVRLGAEIDAIGARRVVLDTIEVLFSVFKDDVVIRSEMKRLFRWLADRGVTAVVTGESGGEGITPARPRGVRRRLRRAPQPSRERRDRDPAAAHPQVPGLRTRHRRVPVSHRRARRLRAAGEFARPPAHRPGGARLMGNPRSRRHVRR